MGKGLRTATVAVLVVLLVAVVAVGALLGWRAWRDAGRTDLERAVGYAPADAQRLSFTDWARVRDEVGSRVDGSSSGSDVERFLDTAFDRDLTSTSALVQSAATLQESYGFSPASAEWELFSQSGGGAVVVVRMPDGTDFDAIGDRLADTGFTRPSGSEQVWRGGDEVLGRITGTVTPELGYVALLPDEHLVLTSDQAPYLAGVVEDLGDGELPEGVRDVVAAAGDPVSAAVYDGGYACSALAMGHADDDEQAEGEALVRRAGEVDPLTGFAMALEGDGDVRVALGFESDDQARTNADTRARLASGPAPGQGGTFPDRFRLGPVAADGRVVTLDLDPTRGSYVLSDLSTGPVLFATC